MPVAYPTTYHPALVESVYHPVTAQANPNQKLNLFLPSGRAPRAGWPTLMHLNLTGYTSTTRSAVVTASDGLLYAALKAGIAVASVSLTVSNQTDATGAYISGRGTFKDPSTANFTGPFIDGALYLYGQSTPEKDTMWAHQGLCAVSETYGLDRKRIIPYGVGAGGTMALWLTYFPEKGGYQGFWPAGSTKPKACVAQSPTAWWGACTAALSGAHFPSSTDASPFNAAPAATLADVTAAHMQDASMLGYAYDLSYNSYIQQADAARRVYLYANLPAGGVESTTFNQTAGASYDTTYAVALNTNFIATTLTDANSAWHSYTMKKQLAEIGVYFSEVGAASRLVVSTNVATSGSGITYDKVIDDSAALIADQVQWLLDVVEVI